MMSGMKQPMADYVSFSDLLDYSRQAGMGEKGNLDPVALQKFRAQGYGQKEMKGGTWVNRSGWMQSQIMRGLPLWIDRTKPTDFHLFSFGLRAQGARLRGGTQKVSTDTQSAIGHINSSVVRFHLVKLRVQFPTWWWFKSSCGLIGTNRLCIGFSDIVAIVGQ